MNDMIPFEGGGQVPAHIRAMFGGADNSDLSAGVSTGFPILSIKGKVWHLVQGGTRTLIADDNGDPRSAIEVVVLKANPNVSKLYYAGGYTEGDESRPTCFSHDGIAPDDGSMEKQALKCAVCPRNQWGSRVTENGAKGKECSDSRRLAVAPAYDLDSPMLLRVPAASLKELVAYGDMLAKRATPYQAVVTKISFDHTVAHQKFVFKPIRWLTDVEVTQVAETMKGTVVTSIIGDGIKREPEPAGPSPLDEMAGAPPANIAAVAALPAPKPLPKKAAPSPEEVMAAVAPRATKGFGSPAPTAPAAPSPGPAATAAEPISAPSAPAGEARDHSKLLLEATASLDDVLGALDD